MASDFTELRIWQKASDLLKLSVGDIELFENEKRTGYKQIGNQLFRSVSSVSANIAEGFGKRSRKEFAQACVISRGEIDESRNWYFQCKNIGLLSGDVVEQRNTSLIEMRKMITSFISKLK